MKSKNHLTIASFLVLVFGFLAQGSAQTNIMPAGFENVTIGMSSNQVQSARTNADFTVKGSLPVSDGLEFYPQGTFFNAVGYDFLSNNVLALITFQPHLNIDSSDHMFGFLKGATAKYGAGYEKRFYEHRFGTGRPTYKTGVLWWDKTNVVVAAEFISPAAEAGYQQAGGDKPVSRYLLWIIQKDALNVSGGLSEEIRHSLPAAQDTTGLSFSNFPAFLDSYTGPVWQ